MESTTYLSCLNSYNYNVCCLDKKKRYRHFSSHLHQYSLLRISVIVELHCTRESHNKFMEEKLSKYCKLEPQNRLKYSNWLQQ